MPRSLPFLIVLAGACTDYNLQDNTDPEGNGTEDPDDNELAGPQPDILVDPLVVDFGTLAKDCEADAQTVTVTNEGDLDLSISGIELDGDGAFSLAATPATLAPGTSLEFDVGFTPSNWQDFSAIVRVTSNDPDEPEVEVGTLGVGAEDAMLEEIFEQGHPSKVDVLWVVDNSGSMGEEVDRLQDSFDVFIGSFVSMGLDYQIGVVSTDMDDPTQSGKLIGSTPIITQNTPDPLATFLANTNLGSGGSADERGLDASYLALTAPLINNENAGMIRADAVLAVIIVSDEDDQSDITQSNYEKWIEGYKGDPAKASLSAVVGAPASSMWDMGGCIDMNSGASASAGTVYVDTAYATGGMWGDICDLDFDLVLKYLSYSAAGLSQEFVLSQTPSNFGQVVVEVDGVEVGYSGIDGWIWDSPNNAVKFNGDSIPGPGATIVVTYPVPAECN